MTAGLPLFENHVEPPVHHDGPETEKRAARSVRASSRSLRERIYRWIRERRIEGAMRDEVDAAFSVTPNVSQPRLRELEIEGRIRKTDRTRLTRSGRQATVYVATEYRHSTVLTPREEWRPIEGYENLYEVSDQGQVRSLRFRNRVCDKRRKAPKLLIPCVTPEGYPYVDLCRDGNVERRSIHRLVLAAFRGPPPPDRPIAAHLNGNPADCRLANLVWASWSENEEHKRLHGRSMDGSRNHQAKLSDDQVAEIKHRHLRGERYEELAAAYGVCYNTVRNIVKERAWRE